jgi:hypothetical protein
VEPGATHRGEAVARLPLVPADAVAPNATVIATAARFALGVVDDAEELAARAIPASGRVVYRLSAGAWAHHRPIEVAFAGVSIPVRVFDPDAPAGAPAGG